MVSMFLEILVLLILLIAVNLNLKVFALMVNSNITMFVTIALLHCSVRLALILLPVIHARKVSTLLMVNAYRTVQ